MNILDFVEDFDNADLPDHERHEQMREAVETFNEENKTTHDPEKTVLKYYRRRDGSKYDSEGPESDAWSGGFAENH
jgi:hypothetical protein